MKYVANPTINIRKRGLIPFFLYPTLWSLAILYPLAPDGYTESYLNVLTVFIGIVTGQEHRSTFKVWYLHSKYPHLCSAASVRQLLTVFLALGFKKHKVSWPSGDHYLVVKFWTKSLSYLSHLEHEHLQKGY